MPPSVGGLEKPVALGFPVAVEEDVAMDDCIVQPLAWCKGTEGVSGEGNGPHLTDFFFRWAVCMDGCLDELPLR